MKRKERNENRDRNTRNKTDASSKKKTKQNTTVAFTDVFLPRLPPSYWAWYSTYSAAQQQPTKSGRQRTRVQSVGPEDCRNASHTPVSDSRNEIRIKKKDGVAICSWSLSYSSSCIILFQWPRQFFNYFGWNHIALLI